MTERKSAAGIVIKLRSAKPVPESDHALFEGLRRLMADCGPNRNDQADTVIMACIGQGINISPRLRSVLKTLGFDARHAGIRMHFGTGTNPALHSWRRDKNGVYELLTNSN